MGKLTAMAYPTKLFLKLADHTYVVACNGVNGWSCWGGTSGDGSHALGSGAGSTKRADAIAGADQRGGITCYLINGVCHQAANRILSPAVITVQGARGYGLSSAMFGTYGRPSGPLGTCKAPFDMHKDVDGDLPGCQAQIQSVRKLAPQEVMPIPEGHENWRRAYLRGVQGIYRKATPLFAGMQGIDLELVQAFHQELFMHKIQFDLGSGLDHTLSRKLGDIHAEIDKRRVKAESHFSHKEMAPTDFMNAFNEITSDFQQHLGGALSRDHYRALVGAEPEDEVILADPEIFNKVYGA
jgi:hypothetical protein